MIQIKKKYKKNSIIKNLKININNFNNPNNFLLIIYKLRFYFI
jgi:hypothetical protein